MSNKRKISLGPLPEQDKDYSVYEQTEVLWGRIALLVVVVLALVFGVLYTILDNNTDSQSHVNALESTQVEDPQLEQIDQKQTELAETASLAISDKDSSEDLPSLTVVTASPKIPEQSAIEAPEQAPEEALEETKPEPENESREAENIEPRTFVASDMKETVVMNSRADVSLVSPVTTLHPSILDAILSSDVGRDKKPVDTLGYEVFMSGEKLIKVVLYIDMYDLEGQTLRHQWVRGDKVEATIKIPVRSVSQQSYSSKYIDPHMMGEWTVNVLDKNGELYARANFIVKE